MVDSMVTVSLETLRDLLIEEVKFLSGVSSQVEEAGRQLKIMHSFLKDADKRNDNSEAVRKFIVQLRDLSIEAENELETYAIQVTSKREGKDLKKVLKRFSCILGEFSSMHQTGTGIKSIMSRMEGLTTNLNRMPEAESSSGSVDDTRSTYGLNVEEHFVGMKKDIEELKSLLTSERSNKVISICGMGGLGKTTLATKVYNLDEVKRCFQARAWICISQKSQPQSIFQGLLKQLLPKEEKEEIMKMDNGDLVTKLREVQSKKNCLMVLDDIWKVDDWDELKDAFPIEEERCKVLLTSRNENIAAEGNVYKLACFSEDEGWELLQKKALSINYSQGLPTNELDLLEKIGKEMVRKCGYLPLPISVIGGILRQGKHLRKWEEVCEQIGLYLQLRGEGVEENKKVEQVLDLSYDVLPYNLKPCFLYLGCFREDAEIETEKLYLLWMAEGMISSEDRKEGETLRDVAERYLTELANRSMVQVKMNESSTYNRFESCHLHDLMRNLCLLKGKKERFLEVADAQQMETHDASSVSRLAVHFNIPEDYLDKCQNLRSLLFLMGKGMKPRSGNINLVSINFGKFKSLKILILEGCKFQNGRLPKGIEKLILLKHLSIQYSTVDKLRKSICKLPCLQSLDLRAYNGIKLPNSISKLRRLRHLYLRAHKKRLAVGGGKFKLEGMNELETMFGFDSSIDDTGDLIKLPKLRVLLNACIRDKDSLSTIVDHILNHQDRFRETSLYIKKTCNIFDSEVDAGSTSLRKILMCRSLSGLKIKCRLNKLPSCEPELGRKLLWLVLEDCHILEDPMEMLGELPMLRELCLSFNAFVGREMVCRANGFPQLKKLYLWDLYSLVEWRMEEKAMSNLSFLKIHDCKKLKMIPEGLEFVTSLKELSITYMPQEFIERVDGPAGKDYDKIKNIPSIELRAKTV